MRRDRRQVARPGLVTMYAYHQPGPGGLPLGLASTEGLGPAAASEIENDASVCNEQTERQLIRYVVYAR